MIREYTVEEHTKWLNEVKELYYQVGLHKTDYSILFLGNQLTIKPRVFSPKYFKNTEWYALQLPTIIGKSSLLEIGTGSGAIALHCKRQGAKVVATDISEDAINCAKENFKNADSNIPLYLGDIYDPLNPSEKYDYIFWNHPYNNSKEPIEDNLLWAGFDFNYNGIRKYISKAHLFLNNPSRGLLLGTGGQADLETIFQIVKENGYCLNLLSHIEMELGTDTTAPNDFRIYELTKPQNMKREDLWKLHSLTTDWIKAADSKAILIVAVMSIIATISTNIKNESLQTLLNNSFTGTILLSSAIYTLISILSAIISLFSQTTFHKKNKSHIFFNDVSKFLNADDYKKAIQTDYDLDDDLISQVHILSLIATRKHMLLQWSVAFLGFSILFITINLLIILIK